MISCIMPRGHMTEQYMRPKRIVKRSNAAMVMVLTASTDGRNWIFAIHPSHLCMTPVKSRKSSVIPEKKMVADTIRISLSFIWSLDVFFIFVQSNPHQFPAGVGNFFRPCIVPDLIIGVERHLYKYVRIVLFGSPLCNDMIHDGECP